MLNGNGDRRKKISDGCSAAGKQDGRPHIGGPPAGGGSYASAARARAEQRGELHDSQDTANHRGPIARTSTVYSLPSPSSPIILFTPKRPITFLRRLPRKAPSQHGGLNHIYPRGARWTAGRGTRLHACRRYGPQICSRASIGEYAVRAQSRAWRCVCPPRSGPRCAHSCVFGVAGALST